MHHQKKQEGYEVKEKNRIAAGGKSLIGLRYVAESKRGTIVKSTWLTHEDEDGTVYKLNTRIREYVSMYGKDCVATDHTLLVRNVGAATKKRVSDSGSHLQHTSIGVVCMSCLTSDHVLDDKDGMGHTCTRCNSWIARYKGEK